MISKKILLCFLLWTCHQHATTLSIFENLQPQIVIAAKRLEFPEFPDAYNPSIIAFGQGYVLTFRYSPDRYNYPWLSYIGVVLLDGSLNPISQPQLLNTHPKNSKTPSQSEDARIFSYRNRLFLIYNDNIEITYPTTSQRRDMFITELFYKDNHFSISSPLKLVYEEKHHIRLWEKNWLPFEHNGTLLLTYMINPHEIIYPNLISGECFFSYESEAMISWAWGSIRGSSPPLLIDGEYLSFFHSGLVTSSPSSRGHNLWHYFMGAYTFSSEPPFRITKMSPTPIIAEGFYSVSNHEKRVIFPGGFAVHGQFIYMAYGKDDHEIWVATIDKEKLKNSLVQLNKNF